MTQTGPGLATATARVAAVLEGLRRINLQVIVVAMPDLPRLEARDRARELAAVARRAGLLETAAAAARQTALRGFAQGGFSGTWAATEMSASVANANDRMAAAAAFEEAAMAAVVEDLAEEETLETLRATADELSLAGSIPAPGSLATLTSQPSSTFERTGSTPIVTAVLVVGLVASWVVGLWFGVLAFVAGTAAIRWLSRRRSAAP